MKPSFILLFLILLLPSIGYADALNSFDYTEYNQVLGQYVDDEGWVDYKNLKANRGGVDRIVQAMQTLTPEEYAEWTSDDQKAFWANAYNVLTLKLIIDRYPIKPNWKTRALFPKNSIRQIPGAWKKVTFEVMGEARTLDGIEHEILRKEWSDPGIHFAIVCASISCPPLRNEAFTGVQWDEQIKDQVKVFLSRSTNFQIDRTKGVLKLNAILNWFQEDFIASAQPLKANLKPALAGVAHYLMPYLDAETQTWLRTAQYKMDWLEYDWSLNEQ